MLLTVFGAWGHWRYHACGQRPLKARKEGWGEGIINSSKVRSSLPHPKLFLAKNVYASQSMALEKHKKVALWVSLSAGIPNQTLTSQVPLLGC